MNNTQQKNYTKEQNELITEFAATYGLEPSQIIFFGDDPKPFFDRDATAVLIQRLIGNASIEDDIVPSPLGDAIAVKYRITFDDGSFGASSGIANIHEKGPVGEPLTFEQLQSLATSRASRSALRNKGIDLVKLHYAARNANVAHAQFSGLPRTNKESLLREVHALGCELGYIFTDTMAGENGDVRYTDKSGWRRMLNTRYGHDVSGHFTEEQLADLAAFLKTQLPNKAAA